MKKYFVKTNGYNCVLFVDGDNKAYVVHEENFDDPLTLEVAKNGDYSNFDGCETAEECANAIGTENAFDNIIDFDKNDSGYEDIIEF